MIEIKKVISEQDIAQTAELAREIWTDHFTPIIGSAQVEYMLEKFQSPDAMARQISGGYEYFLAVVDGKNVGYLALVPDAAVASLMISKIYVKKDTRGQGVGHKLLNFAISVCRERHLNSIWLTVNKHNADSIAWYERKGFENADTMVQDIGNGFIMDDYKMVKSLGPRKARREASPPIE
ncbi:MAG: GNAT family N-acetyltransferase [Kiritimatiellae bacterium]|jgi:ribosomal protein S18 acetylase RimI-like enzyme|nr:GNAT family N-acetyltransferase [Kiritimatiellia bacterium]